MNRVFFLLLLSLIFIVSAKLAAQDFSIRAGIGYGTYSMDDMTTIQNDMLRQIKNSGIENAKAVSSFPGYLNFYFELIRNFSANSGVNGRFGLSFEHYSTGGRIDYGDYSGRVNFDQLLTCNCFGGFGEVRGFKNNFLSGYFGVKISFISSSLKINSLSRLYEKQESTEFKFNSASAGIEPYFYLEFPFLSQFSTLVKIGYSIDTEGELKYEDNDKMSLISYGANKAASSWTGLRTSIGLSYNF